MTFLQAVVSTQSFFHTLIIFLNCSSLIFMSSIGSRSGTPSGNRRITSCIDLPTLNRLSEDLRSLGRYNRTLLNFAMCLSSTGTTYRNMCRAYDNDHTSGQLWHLTDKIKFNQTNLLVATSNINDALILVIFMGSCL